MRAVLSPQMFRLVAHLNFRLHQWLGRAPGRLHVNTPLPAALSEPEEIFRTLDIVKEREIWGMLAPRKCPLSSNAHGTGQGSLLNWKPHEVLGMQSGRQQIQSHALQQSTLWA